MQITRRNFIQTLGSAGVFIAAGGATAVFSQRRVRTDLFPIPAEVYSEPLYSMTANQFEPLIGQAFSATAADGVTAELVLAEVNRLELQANTLRGYYGEVFSLVFEGSRRERLAQDSYEIHVDGLPNFTALVVPTGRVRRKYEIIINHLTR